MRLLLIQNKITHYNLPIYNILGKEPSISLTIAHFDSIKVEKEKNFNELLFHSWKLGPFYFSKENLYLICQNYDVVICMADMHWISLMALGLRKRRKFKLIYWGIGVSASYNNKFDENKGWDFLRFYFMKQADGLIFYSSYPVEKYVKNGFAKEKLFVAHNTVVVTQNQEESSHKDILLFVGMLYKEKGIFELLDVYKRANLASKNLPELIIVGGGDEFDNILNWINVNDLGGKILMKGPIYDDKQLEKLFIKSIACISPNQAGLSVLTSMGYGVPFITKFDSITGGERFNIINNETGVIYKTDDELFDILNKIKVNKELFIIMGENAKKFYNNFRKPEQMVRGFLDAIEFVNLNKENN